MIRSLLYVPASSERFLAKAHERGADAIILDLEDAVAPREKARARAALMEAVPSVRRNGATVFVRINAVSTGLALDDAEAACRAGAFGLFVAKVQSPAELKKVHARLGAVEPKANRERPVVLVPMLEDPGAVFDARAIAAASPRTFALVSGSEDMATAMGAEPTPEVLRLPKLLVHLAAKAAGLVSFGMLRTVADFADTAAVAASARARRACSATMARAASTPAWCRSSTRPSRRRRRRSIGRAAWSRPSRPPRPKARGRSCSRARWSTSRSLLAPAD
jgi:citrate lyase subunit beta / citryl-CoA lyase